MPAEQRTTFAGDVLEVHPSAVRDALWLHVWEAERDLELTSIPLDRGAVRWLRDRLDAFLRGETSP